MAEYKDLLENQPKGMCDRYTSPINVTVPGEVHQHLLSAGIIDHDPLYRTSSMTNYWVTLQQQTYETTFTLSELELTRSQVIHLDLVGTIATVYVNDQAVGYIDNIYRTYYLEVPSVLLVTGDNRLRIDIESTVRYTYANAANYTQDVAEDYFWSNMWLTPSWV
jgi:beta-galactosidase/beta-glucuronidase